MPRVPDFDSTGRSNAAPDIRSNIVAKPLNQTTSAIRALGAAATNINKTERRNEARQELAEKQAQAQAEKQDALKKKEHAALLKAFAREKAEAQKSLLADSQSQADKLLNNLLYDPETGYTRKKLNDAASDFVVTQKAFKEGMSKISGGLKDPETIRLFELYASDRENTFERLAGTHFSQEREKFKTVAISNMVGESRNIARNNYWREGLVEEEIQKQLVMVNTDAAGDPLKDPKQIEANERGIRAAQYALNADQAMVPDDDGNVDRRSIQRMLDNEQITSLLTPQKLTALHRTLDTGASLDQAIADANDSLRIPLDATTESLNEWSKEADLTESTRIKAQNELREKYKGDSRGLALALQQMNAQFGVVTGIQKQFDEKSLLALNERVKTAGSTAGRIRLYQQAMAKNPRLTVPINNILDRINRGMANLATTTRTRSGGMVSPGVVAAAKTVQQQAMEKEKNLLMKFIDNSRDNSGDVTAGMYAGAEGLQRLKQHLTLIQFEDADVKEVLTHYTDPRVTDPVLKDGFKKAFGKSMDDDDVGIWRTRMLARMAIPAGVTATVDIIAKNMQIFRDDLDADVLGDLTDTDFNDLIDAANAGDERAERQLATALPDIDPGEEDFEETLRIVKLDPATRKQYFALKDEDRREDLVRMAFRALHGFRILSPDAMNDLTPLTRPQQQELDFGRNRAAVLDLVSKRQGSVIGTLAGHASEQQREEAAGFMGDIIGVMEEESQSDVGALPQLDSDIDTFGAAGKLPPWFLKSMTAAFRDSPGKLKLYLDAHFPDPHSGTAEEQKVKRQLYMKNLRTQAGILVQQATTLNLRGGF